MAEFDLTKINCQFLDRHLTFPLLEFLCGKDIYDQKDLLEYILDTVNRTNMIDYTMDTRKRLNFSHDMPEDLVYRKEQVLATLKQLQNEVAPIMKATDILKNGESMKDSKTFVNALQKDYNFKGEHLESAYKLAKYLYECGNYQESASYLYFCLIVMAPNDKVNIYGFNIAFFTRYYH